MKNGMTMEGKLMEYLTFFEFSDFIGLGTYIGLPQNRIKEMYCLEPDFENFIIDMVAMFSEKSRKSRREILKLARGVAANNKKQRSDK